MPFLRLLRCSLPAATGGEAGLLGPPSHTAGLRLAAWHLGSPEPREVKLIQYLYFMKMASQIKICGDVCKKHKRLEFCTLNHSVKKVEFQ